ncbi:penicillin-binding protein 3 [Marinithermofilum abyssi]|uniref:Penicillin-binding protein 3 n=1 Tax=Marinithermofilum abyssi TaxID=1571185 RepID=A0A8J2VFV8_9BACL|nr:penicillin-binding transpeptidase domain-containing protein [Marinithermofilum abyssi]GGE18092.1 penicillin-binding protein 3 [Marinithermofilum abyssi]
MESGKLKEHLSTWKSRLSGNKRLLAAGIGVAVACTAVIGIAWAYQADSAQPSPSSVMNQYMKDWEKGRYDQMYALLSENAKKQVDKKTFVQRHKAIADGIKQEKIDLDVKKVRKTKTSALPFGEEKAVASYSASYGTQIVGKIAFQNKANLTKEDNGWRIDWQPSMIFPELEKGDQVRVTRIPPGERGEIFARNGEPLAVNNRKVDIGIIPNQTHDLSKTTQALAKELNMDAAGLQQKLESAKGKKADQFIPVKTFTGKDADQTKSLVKIPGVVVQDHSTRYYPQKDLTAHVVGYVRQITVEELKKHKGEGYRQGDWLGQKGLEYALEDKLRGKPGWQIVTVGPDGKRKKVIDQRNPQDGQDFKITIDLQTQKQLYDGIRKDKGAGVALHPKTGEVLAMVSAPSYDPNQFVTGLSSSEWKRLNGPTYPLTNRTLIPYSPGSTMKPITASIGLDTKKITPQTTYNTDSGKWQKDSSWGGYFVTRVPNPEGGVDLGEALAWSDNIYFARVGVKLGANTMIDYLKRYGFGKKMDFPLDTPPSQYSNNGQIQSEILLADTAYGQGQLLISPLHLAAMYTTFSNDGDMLKPQLIMKDGKSVKPEIWQKDVIAPATAKKVDELLTGVVTRPKGSAHDLKTAGVRLGAKTGTAELKKSKDDKDQRQLGWLATISGKEGQASDLITATMVDEVQDRGGSHYIFPTIKKMLKARYQ